MDRDADTILQQITSLIERLVGKRPENRPGALINADLGRASRPPLFRAAAILGVALGACASTDRSSLELPLSQAEWRYFARELSSPALSVCENNRILLAPGAKSAALWHERFAFFPYERRASAPGDNKITVLSNLEGRTRAFTAEAPGWMSRPLSWAPDGSKLFLISGYSTIGFLSAASADAGIIGDLPNEWRSVRFSTTAHADAPSQLAAAANIVSSIAPVHRQGGALATIGRDQVHLAVAPSIDAEFQLVGAGAPRPSGMPVLMARDAQIGINDGRPFIVGRGKSRADNAAKDVAYRRPLFDLTSGRLVGSFGLREISTNGRLANSVVSAVKLLPHPFIIRDVSVSGEAVAILHSDLDGELAVAIAQGDQVRSVVVCDREQQAAAREFTAKGGPNPFGQPVEFLRGREEAWGPQASGRQVFEVDLSRFGDGQTQAIGTVITGRKSKRRELLIHFDGGPGMAAVDSEMTDLLRRMNVPEADLMMVEYSGSAARSPDLFRALARGGAAAIERDVAALGAWIQQQSYDRVHIIAASFGSVPAFAALSKPPLQICSASLIVPLLRYRTINELSRPGRDLVALEQRRRAFHEAMLGDPDGEHRLQDWMNAKIARSVNRRVSLFFAKKDVTSSPSDLPASATPASTLELHGDHNTLYYNPQLWEAVRSRITAPACS